MSDEGLFGQEEAVIRAGEACLSSDPDRESLLDSHERMLKDYKKLFNQTKRLVRINDRQQAELNRKTKELHIRNQFIRKTFGRYLSDEVVEELFASPDGLELGGKSLNATVVFSDLRGFSAISESLPPEAVVEMLNDYLKVMTEIIFRHQGTINEIMGDGILMLFGAPATRPDDADRAIACAVEMQLAMEKVNAGNREKGFPELEMGIGINTGRIVAGNVGSDMRVKYAVVGSHVNLAARVESHTVGGQILATKYTLDAINSDVRIGREFSSAFKGFSEPVTICEITGIGEIGLGKMEDTPLLLNPSLEVSIELLDGKESSGEIHEGRITHLAKKTAFLSSPVNLKPRSNLKITWLDMQLYAKVMKPLDRSSEIRFTSVPEAFFGSLALLAEGGYISIDEKRRIILTETP